MKVNDPNVEYIRRGVEDILFNKYFFIKRDITTSNLVGSLYEDIDSEGVVHCLPTVTICSSLFILDRGNEDQKEELIGVIAGQFEDRLNYFFDAVGKNQKLAYLLKYITAEIIESPNMTRFCITSAFAFPGLYVLPWDQEIIEEKKVRRLRLTKEQREQMGSEISKSGLFYTMDSYSNWEDVKSKRFHQLRNEYLESLKNVNSPEKRLLDFIGYKEKRYA